MRNKAFSKKILCLVVIGSLMSSTLAYAESSTLIVTQPINNSAALTKDETVFATLDSTGAPKSTSVTSWIHSDSMLPEIKDKSSLTNIKNLKGSETPTKNGENLVWKTDKTDIFYSGDSSKTLPIGIKIVYYLNDKEISAKDLAGKSGKVKIKIDFDNKTKKMININGKAKTVCESIPITTVINMPVGNFSKIVATDGTIVKVGNNNVLTFISVPGFQESLGLKNGDLGVTLANSVVVTAEAKDFKLAPIYFAASPDLLDLENIAGGPSILGDLTAKLSGAKEKLPQLKDGVSKLDSGLGTLKSSVAELNTGLQGKILPGAAKLAGGAKEVNDGVQLLAPGSAKIAEGVQKLDTALNSTAVVNGKPTGLVAATDVLYKNILQVDGAVNGTKDASGNHVKGFKDYSGELLNGFSTEAKDANGKPLGMRGGLLQAQAGVQLLIDNTRKLVQAAKTDPVLAIKLLKYGIASITDPTGAKTLAQLDQLQAGMKELVDNTALTVNPSETNPHKTKTLCDGLNIYNNNMRTFGAMAQAGLPDAKLFDDSVHQLGNSVNKELLPGTQQLNGGLAKLSANTPALSAGAQELNGGLALVGSGISSKLVPGIDQLKAGSGQIATGVGPLLSKVTPLLTKVDDVLAAKDEMVKIAKENNSFSGVDPSMKGSLKFVMQTGDIKVDDSGAKKELKTEKKSFWDKVYDAFVK